MIRKLRWKFVAINMLFVTTVLLAVFLSVFHSSRVSMRTNSTQLLQHVVQEEDSPGMMHPGKGTGTGKGDGAAAAARRHFRARHPLGGEPPAHRQREAGIGQRQNRQTAGEGEQTAHGCG